jgi:sporulation protein YlmC with PRC-barrel domain
VFLIRDVLDKQMVDRDGHKLGKVDGAVLELRDDGPPRLVYLEVGATTLARRLGRRLGHLARALARRWGGAHTDAYRIPWTRVRDVGIDIDVDVKCEETRIYVLEDWLRTHIVERIPGGKSR